MSVCASDEDGGVKEVMKVLLFKACPRCRGDMYENRDIYGDYKECLMCGLMVDIDNTPSLLAASRSSVKTKPRKKKAA